MSFSPARRFRSLEEGRRRIRAVSAGAPSREARISRWAAIVSIRCTPTVHHQSDTSVRCQERGADLPMPALHPYRAVVGLG